jgi:hypothetical protein
VSLKANRAICMISQIALSHIKMAVRLSASNLTDESPSRCSRRARGGAGLGSSSTGGKPPIIQRLSDLTSVEP